MTLGLLTSILVFSGFTFSAAPVLGVIENLQGLGNFQAVTGGIEFRLEGSLDFAPIYLDGYFLFEVAAAVPQFESDPTDALPIESRVRLIQTRLKTYVRGYFDPQSVKVSTLHKQTGCCPYFLTPVDLETGCCGFRPVY